MLKKKKPDRPVQLRTQAGGNADQTQKGCSHCRASGPDQQFDPWGLLDSIAAALKPGNKDPAAISPLHLLKARAKKNAFEPVPAAHHSVSLVK